MSGNSACPSCGKSYTERNVVGKSETRERGERHRFPVVVCTCGNIFKGKQIT